MTPARLDELKVSLRARFDAERRNRLDALRAEIGEALALDEGDLETARASFRALKGLTLPEGDYPAMVAAWPASFDPLPEWLADPAAAELKDPPGQPHVIVCAPLPPPEEGEGAESPAIAPDLETQILAKRRERAAEEDAAREAGRGDGRAAVPEDFGLVTAEA